MCMENCEHNFQYKSEDVTLKDVNNGWYDAKRVIIFCSKCGKVTHDLTNSNSSYQCNNKHKD